MTVFSILRRVGISLPPVPAAWYAIPLRLIIGFGFLQHGYAKLVRGPEAFIAILHTIGMPFAALLGWATIVVEIVGGLLVLVGALVPLASVPMVVVLLVAIVTVHPPNGFSSIKLLSYDSTRGALWPAGLRDGLALFVGTARAVLRRRRTFLRRQIFEARRVMPSSAPPLD
jgi:putative oxidoreductase